MKTITSSLPLSMVRCGLLAGFWFLWSGSQVQAQNAVYYGQGFFGFGGNRAPNVQPPANEMGRNLLALDNLVTEIKWRCGRELQKNRDSREWQTLFTEMKGLAETSELLLQAYQSQNRSVFVASARNIQSSLNRVEALHKKAALPTAIHNLILQSKPMVTYIASQAETYQMGR